MITIQKAAGEHTEALSHLITRCLLEVNSRDYPLTVLKALAAGYTPTKLAEIMAESSLFIALDEAAQPIGCGAVSDRWGIATEGYIHAVFTHPEKQGQGTGSAIMQALEAEGAARGYSRIELAASLTAEGFYTALGWQYKGGTRTLTENNVVPMEKTISKTQEP